ncbi:MAG TPA: phosphoribosylamine--glycine ligase [Stellaceae bacterium]|jgi:phosphoribosylamine--glycine ligase|nr:phosphoribosylamine--glycine ligase [Stellaceae bacterium]
MRVLVVGSGGREHALAWAIAASPLVDRLYCAPGNAGIAEEALCVPIRTTDIAGLVGFCRRERIDFVVIGPEAPLALGLVDALAAEGVPAFGPSAVAAALEASKSFAKDLCARAGVPTAPYRCFRDPAAAKAYIAAHGAPIVVKANGLAAGKGVTVAMDLDAAFAAVDAALVERRFSVAGLEIVVEDFLEGEEASFFALVDGKDALPLATARDHKRVGEDDTGPNTGGMGAVSPAAMLTPALEGQVMDRIVMPTIAAMRAQGRVFKGVLYAGLMLTETGPMLLEYNVRFGDPEAQVLMMRLISDPIPALIAAQEGVLRQVDLRWRAETALCVVMAARGYPGEPLRGSEIRGLDRAGADPEVKIFHAATRREPATATAEGSRLVADGGRVLGVTASGSDLAQASARAYAAIERIDWPEGFCRRDIGRRAGTA